MEKIMEYVKDIIMYGNDVKDLTEFINSIKFEKFNVEKSEENIHRIEEQVITDLTIELDSLDEFLDKCHFDNPALFQILENQRKNIKKVINNE